MVSHSEQDIKSSWCVNNNQTVDIYVFIVRVIKYDFQSNEKMLCYRHTDV